MRACREKAVHGVQDICRMDHVVVRDVLLRRVARLNGAQEACQPGLVQVYLGF